METNLRSLVALVLLLVPFLAGKFVRVLFYYVLYSKKVYIYIANQCCCCCFTVVFLSFIFSFVFSVLDEDKALSQIFMLCTPVPLSQIQYIFPQLPNLALMEQFVWLMDWLRVQAEWRSASMECGEEFVVIIGMVCIPELCADSWGTMLMQEKVS